MNTSANCGRSATTTPWATTGSVGAALDCETSAMSKARFSAVESWRLLVGYSTSSTAPVRTMSLRFAFGLGPSARTTAGTADVARRLANRAMPAWLSKTGPATRTSNGPCSRTSSSTSMTLVLVTTWYPGPSED